MRIAVIAAVSLVMGLGAGHAFAQPAAGTNAAAVADAGRPQADRDRDAARKPLEMLTIAGVRPGMRILEMLPGGGYFTRIFSKAVGPTGRVLAVLPPSPPAPATPPATPPAPPPVRAIAADPAYSNVEVIQPAFTALPSSPPADLVWTSQNYHDLHLARLNVDVAAVNRSVFQALRPGGLYVIVDHAAAPGAPVTIADTLHRIDPAIVRREVEAAGFEFVSESPVLHNPADNHTLGVFDASLRGHTDQFVLVFRRPR